MLGISYTEPF